MSLCVAYVVRPAWRPFFFFFNDTATTEIYTLSLHDALPIFDLVGAAGQPLDAAACAALLGQRSSHPALAPHPALPADTRLWAALQRASGGTWAGCVYDVDRIVAALEAGADVLARRPETQSAE